jgi:hypothetical protein
MRVPLQHTERAVCKVVTGRPAAVVCIATPVAVEVIGGIDGEVTVRNKERKE